MTTMTGPSAAHLKARDAMASLLDVDEVAWVGLSAPVEVDLSPICISRRPLPCRLR
jgi:hypothetical protein